MRKRGLSMPSAWEHPCSELFFATGAFGVGIDLKNFRHLAHIHVPWSMEEHLQEQVELEGMTSHHKINMCTRSIILMILEKQKNPVSSYSMREYVKSERCKTEMVMS